MAKSSKKMGINFSLILLWLLKDYILILVHYYMYLKSIVIRLYVLFIQTIHQWWFNTSMYISSIVYSVFSIEVQICNIGPLSVIELLTGSWSVGQIMLFAFLKPFNVWSHVLLFVKLCIISTDIEHIEAAITR